VNRLFVRTLVTVLAALLVLIAVMAVVAVVGFSRSLDVWEHARNAQLEETARQILLNYPEIQSVVVPEEVPCSSMIPGDSFFLPTEGRVHAGEAAAAAHLRRGRVIWFPSKRTGRCWATTAAA